MQTNRRSLIIGLGHSGKLVAQQFKQLLEQRYRCLPYISFYVVDRVEEQPGENQFLPAEELALSDLGIQDFVNQNAPIKTRIPKQLWSNNRPALDFNTDSDRNLIDTRLGANLLFMRKAKQAYTALDKAVRRLFDEKEWPEAKREGFQPEESTDVTIYLIASLAEPYGGGLLTDMAYLVQNLNAFANRSYSCSTTGILLLFGNSKDNSTAKANAFATLKELDHYMIHKDYENSYLGISKSDKRPFSRACHLIDLKNEAGFPFSDSEAARAMVVEWLHQMIFNPLETDTIDIRLQQLAPAEESDETQSTRKKIQAYSSFGYAAYSIPLDQISKYYAARFGAELLSDQCLLAQTASSEETSDIFQAFWRDEEKLEPENVIGLHPEAAETRVSLSTPEQNQATVLFEMSSRPSSDIQVSESSFPSRSDIPLEELRKRILSEISAQEDTYFPLYVKKMRAQLASEWIPEISNVIAYKSRTIVEERPIGGLTRASKFLEGLQTRLNETQTKLQDIQPKAKAEADTVAGEYGEARVLGDAALQNRPHWQRTLGRMGILLSGAVLIVGLFTYALVTKTHTADWGTIWSNFITILLLPQGQSVLILMGIAGVLKYIVDDIVGGGKVARGEDNIPSPIMLASSIVGLFIIGALLIWIFYRSTEVLTLPIALQPLESSRYQGWIVYGIVALGVWAVLNYIFWYFFDKHQMLQLASQWMDAHDKLAKHKALLERIEVGREFYKAAEAATQDQLREVQAFRSKLEELQQVFEKEARERLETLRHADQPFKKIVIDGSKVESIYREHISDIKHESTQFFREPRPSFVSWREGEPTTIQATINSYVNERFNNYWGTHGVTQLLTPNLHPSSLELQKSLSWLADAVSKPFWPYMGGTQGIVRVYIGVGSQEAETNLLSAFNNLSGPLGAEPMFLDTRDKHTIWCITFRYGLPLYLLTELASYEKDYAAHAGKNHSLHSNADLEVTLTNYSLLADENKAPLTLSKEPKEEKKRREGG
ncbi:hypothetical protein HY230_00315 [Candidatus Acetothermia bacterium]|nr:hypothetical protein [Candidatus Acetothermia bacterium]